MGPRDVEINAAKAAGGPRRRSWALLARAGPCMPMQDPQNPAGTRSPFTRPAQHPNKPASWEAGRTARVALPAVAAGAIGSLLDGGQRLRRQGTSAAAGPARQGEPREAAALPARGRAAPAAAAADCKMQFAEALGPPCAATGRASQACLLLHALLACRVRIRATDPISGAATPAGASGMAAAAAAGRRSARAPAAARAPASPPHPATAVGLGRMPARNRTC